jgi:16S rRNA (uracil1498-N3)-methyltransferase
MQIPRVYQNIPLKVGDTVALSNDASNHLARVLRLTVNAEITLFNGFGAEFAAKITHIDKKCVSATLTEYRDRDVESPLTIHLAQGISRGEKMDHVIQKAVELGVHQITPLFTERCTVQLTGDRREKRLQHWQAIAVSACEQSGRNRIPLIATPQSLSDWLKPEADCLSIVLHHRAASSLSTLGKPQQNTVRLLIGPEGGLSTAEIDLATARGFIPICLGPRVLRTETAPLAILAALQCLWGDFAT